MKKAGLAKYIENFFGDYLSGECGCSINTIKTYAVTFSQFFRYFKECQLLKAEKITLDHLTKESVINFLKWLEDDRKVSVSTRNARLATIHAFCHYLQYQDVQHISRWQDILSIRTKKHKVSRIEYLTVDQIKNLLNMIDVSSSKGRRNLALLGLLYDGALRVQELIDLTPADYRSGEIPTIRVTGKGNKVRSIPLSAKQAQNLMSYMREHNLTSPENLSHPLFPNFHGDKLSRMSVLNILKKYVDKARTQGIKMPNRTGCHILRHSKAMHLLEAGVNLVYIRDFLGHESVHTTEIYARVSDKLKDKALEKISGETVPAEGNSWNKDPEILAYLKSLQNQH